jgi:hypothetical protein
MLLKRSDLVAENSLSRFNNLEYNRNIPKLTWGYRQTAIPQIILLENLNRQPSSVTVTTVPPGPGGDFVTESP